MADFSIPRSEGGFFNFSVPGGCILFAGSRHGYVDARTCSLLLDMFGKLGFKFMTGCAKGIDSCFRQAFVRTSYSRRFSTVACAFKSKTKEFTGTYNLFVVPPGLHPRAALAKRTLWMVSKCSLVILFPSTPIGKGSSLAFRTAVTQNKPVFVVSQTEPSKSDLYGVYPSSLFGIVHGYWCVPPVYHDTGLCHEV